MRQLELRHICPSIMHDIFPIKEVKTRKHHECFICERQFEPGAKMTCQQGKYDGDFYSVYSCKTYQSLMDFLEPNDENAYDLDCLEEAMASDKFSGTAEEYLAFKIKERDALQAIIDGRAQS